MALSMSSRLNSPGRLFCSTIAFMPRIGLSPEAVAVAFFLKPSIAFENSWKPSFIMVATSAFGIGASGAGASPFAAVGGVVVLGDGAVVVDCAPNSFAPAAFSSVGFAAVGVVVAGVELGDVEAGASTFMAVATGVPPPLE